MLYGIPAPFRVHDVFEPLAFTWDDAKARSNADKHKIDFNFAVLVFDDPFRVEWNVSRLEDNEQRWKTVGMLDGTWYTVVFTMRDEICRVISARRSNASEERRYGNRPL